MKDDLLWMYAARDSLNVVLLVNDLQSLQT